MTKKDYVLIANTLREARLSVNYEITYTVYNAFVTAFQIALKRDNPDFDARLFHTATR